MLTGSTKKLEFCLVQECLCPKEKQLKQCFPLRIQTAGIPADKVAPSIERLEPQCLASLQSENQQVKKEKTFLPKNSLGTSLTKKFPIYHQENSTQDNLALNSGLSQLKTVLITLHHLLWGAVPLQNYPAST